MALIMYTFMTYREDLESERMVPTMAADGLVPLCMEQARRLFSTTRIPGRECDTIKHWPVTQQSPHVVVLCNGAYYRLDLANEEGDLVPPHVLEKQLVEIKADALKSPPDGAEV